MTKLVNIAEMQTKLWGKIHKEVVEREKAGDSLEDAYMAAIQLCSSNLIELKDSAGTVITRKALLDAGLQQPLIKELMHLVK